MTEKIGLVKNPLTIIAIFAGIAEVSGTIVLPFIAEGNQAIFVWFLMIFPSLLVVVFFLTLNFNSKALYAPSDYQNEDNYLQIHRYDKATKEEVGVRVSVSDQIQSLTDQQQRLLALISEINTNQHHHGKETQETVVVVESKPDKSDQLDQSDQDDLSSFSFLVSDVFNPSTTTRFIQLMRKYGYTFKVYKPMRGELHISVAESGAIWLGARVPFRAARKIVSSAKMYYPLLKYIHIDGDFADRGLRPSFEDKQVFIGGATTTAIEYGLSPLSEDDFRRLRATRSEADFYSIIRSKYANE